MVAIRVLTACLLWSATCLAASAAAPHVLSDAPRFAPAASASDVMKGASETDVNEVMRALREEGDAWLWCALARGGVRRGHGAPSRHMHVPYWAGPGSHFVRGGVVFPIHGKEYTTPAR